LDGAIVVRLLYANNAYSTLAGPISSTALTLVLQAGAGALFPQPVAGSSYFTITMIPQLTGLPGEIMWCTARSDDTLTVTRGKEGTVPTSYLAGDTVSNQVTQGGLSSFLQMPTYAGNPNGYVAGQAGSATESPDAIYDTADNLVWVCTVGSSNPASAVWTRLASNGSLINTQVFASSGTYDPSSVAVNFIRVRGVGAGGAGGGSAANSVSGNFSVGGGGGAGAYAELMLGGIYGGTFSSGLTVTVPAGGTGNLGAAGNPGGNGSGVNAVFGPLSIPFGTGGQSSASVSSGAATSAAEAPGGATPSTSAGTLLVSNNGNNGANGLAFLLQVISGVGGSSLFGGPGGNTNSGNGGNATGYGAGGGGAASFASGSTSAAMTGGAGAPAYFVVEEYA
jgi:hypothetical protein